MAERRKRKSFWDVEEEAKHPSGTNEPNSWSAKEQQFNYDDGRYHGFSATGTTSVPKSTDNSGQAPWESADENPTALISDSFIKRRHDASEAKEVGGADRYFKTMSPGFDGMERHNHNNTFEDDRSHSHRYPVRGRSRSRGRASGRSRSRSLSRGREKERGSGWSRSRSRSNGSARDQTRSRSPIEGYRRQTYGWGDRNRGPDKSSQICRDFAGGGCRRGSQCRFFHPNPNNSSHRSGDHLDNDPAESWRNRGDRSRLSKYDHSRGPEFEMQDGVSDSHHGKDEQFARKSRNDFPCKDFMRGNCRWADSCEFSHHVSSGNSFGKDSRVRSFNNDIMQQSNQYVKPLCKFFAAGKCDRNNCRFSHEDSKPNNLEPRGTGVYDQYSLHDKSSWSGDAMRVSDTVNTIGWGDTPLTNTINTADTTNRVAQTMENERDVWGIPEWKDKSFNRDRQLSPKESGSHDRDISTIESFSKDNVANKHEQLFFGEQLQSQDEVLKLQQQRALQENTDLSIKTLQQNVPSASHIQQQQHRLVENNILNQFVSGVFEGMEDSQNNATHSLLFSGPNLNRNGESILLRHSSISKETNRGQNMLYPMPSNEIITDLNVPEAKIAVPSNSPDQMPNPQKAIKSPDMLESKVLQFFPKLNNENSAQLTNSPAIIPGRQIAPVSESPTTHLTQRFVNEQAQTYQGGIHFNSKGIETSISDTSVHATNDKLNPSTVSINLFNSMGNGRDPNEHCNYFSAPVTEQNSQIDVKLSSPSSGGTKIDKVKDLENEELKQEEIAVKPEDKAHGEESREVIIKPSTTPDGHGKVEEGNTYKDEKGMRVFKNALIEFVKEILKPIWKEGRMSREVHKTVVKKVVDKVTGTIQVDHIPKTQDKAEHYLSCSKPKITKLVQAYVDRCRKTES